MPHFGFAALPSALCALPSAPVGAPFEICNYMARTAAAAEKATTIEQGSVTILYRPRVEEQDPSDLGDVQRLLILLSPEGGTFERVIAVGRKRLPRSAKHDRFWGFVDLVLTAYDMNAALDAHVYGTKTRGLRHLPAARAFASGSYEIATHRDHGHLRWHVDRITNADPIAWGLLEPPDLQTALFDDLELHVTIPTPFPPNLQQRFGNRRYAHLDTPEWLDHPGAELVFVGAAD